MPQGGAGGAGTHGQPQAGSSPSTPGPAGGGLTGGATGSGGGATGFSTGAAGAASFGLGVTGGTIGGGSTGGGAGGGAAASGTGWGSKGPARRGRGWRDWRRGDPTLIKGLWKSKGPLGNRSFLLDICLLAVLDVAVLVLSANDSLGQAEVYIILALLIGFITVVIGCWLSDNCWSPEPEGRSDQSSILRHQFFFESSWKKASMGNVGSSVVILKCDETSLLSGETALNIPGLSLGSRERKFPAVDSVAPSAKVHTQRSLAFCGGTDRGTVSADDTAASRFEDRDNRPVAPGTRSGNAARTDSSG
ncbi:hypothetical protein X777_06748 [Ooceraea biroi]|uniref:Uncharacterized protein n=1 Tax=Ooceraea biroi TaxID=2015173 RepID=A0A026X1A2_OOCBI|nr:hypothetical protein X777_06748 [Ooceraea biroi]